MLAITLGLAARAQAPAATAELELKALDQQWMDAEVKHDRETLERILDEGFVITWTSGATSNRAEFIERILAGPVAPFEVVHDMIRLNGDTAVVIDRFGEGLAIKCTWVAVKRQGRWRVITEHMTRISQAKK